MNLKKGDKVKVANVLDKLGISQMKSYLGKTGIVIGISAYGDKPTATVMFENEQLWNFLQTSVCKIGD